MLVLILDISLLQFLSFLQKNSKTIVSRFKYEDKFPGVLRREKQDKGIENEISYTLRGEE